MFRVASFAFFSRERRFNIRHRRLVLSPPPSFEIVKAAMRIDENFEVCKLAT
jgi:hypothetical protein